MALDKKKSHVLRLSETSTERVHGTLNKEDEVKFGRFFLENNFLRAEIDKQGLITITDKKTENVFKNLGKFQLSEKSENGVNKNVLYQKQQPRISIVSMGPLKAGIKVRKRLKITSKHIRGWRVVKVWVTYFLRSNSQFLEAFLRVENSGNKYILDMLFPTECEKVRETINMSSLKLHKHIHCFDDLKKIEFNGFVSVSSKNRSLNIFTERPSSYGLKLDNFRTISINIYNSPLESDKKAVNYRSNSRFGVFPGGGISEKEIAKLFKIYEKFLLKS